MNKNVIAKEWIIFISSTVFGFALLPILLVVAFNGNLSAFYNALSNSENTDFTVAWSVAIGPYVLLQATRMTIWSIKQLKKR
jgi:uncharacterized membrane protein